MAKIRPLPFDKAARSFVGHLEGTGKAAHTISSYRGDLATFRAFLQEGLGKEEVPLARLRLADLERYDAFLKARGLRRNSRRRKILTVRRWLRYLGGRHHVAPDFAARLPSPPRLERVPEAIDPRRWLEAVRALPMEPPLAARNRVLLWALAETGALVSEIARLRFTDWSGDGPSVDLPGKRGRRIRVSRDLYEAVQAIRTARAEVFLGFNRFGPLPGFITPRGVELIVKAYGARLGFPGATPRSIRHSTALRWHREGASLDEIRERLGLRSASSFRAYEALFSASPVT